MLQCTIRSLKLSKMDQPGPKCLESASCTVLHHISVFALQLFHTDAICVSVIEALKKNHKEELERELEKVRRLNGGGMDAQTLQLQQK